MKESLIVTGVGLVVLGLIGLGLFAQDKYNCSKIEEGGTQSRYELISGCYVNVNDRWIPLDNWRGEYEQ